MDSIGARIVKKLDKHVEAALNRQGDGRGHLGASVLGRECVRQIWYGWRWARITQHQGRMLRLFDRGHREEPALVRWLELTGFLLRPYSQKLMWHEPTDDYELRDWGWNGDPMDQWDRTLIEVTGDLGHVQRAEERGVKLQQWKIQDHDKHFGGSSDGILVAPMDFPELNALGPGLAEFKTHNLKSFEGLAGKLVEYRKWVTAPDKVVFPGKGVLTAKLEHYIQMQVYMHYLNLKWALYMAVCKDTDDLYIEVIHYKPEMAEAYRTRAAQIIAARVAPARVSNDSSWFKCKMCDFREICHHGQKPQKNCRSCQFATPAENGSWYCQNFSQTIPPEFITQGCNQWDPIE